MFVCSFFSGSGVTRLELPKCGPSFTDSLLLDTVAGFCSSGYTFSSNITSSIIISIILLFIVVIIILVLSVLSLVLLVFIAFIITISLVVFVVVVSILAPVSRIIMSLLYVLDPIFIIHVAMDSRHPRLMVRHGRLSFMSPAEFIHFLPVTFFIFLGLTVAVDERFE